MFSCKKGKSGALECFQYLESIPYLFSGKLEFSLSLMHSKYVYQLCEHCVLERFISSKTISDSGICFGREYPLSYDRKNMIHLAIVYIVVVVVLLLYAMVMSGWSINLTTLFLGRLNQCFVCALKPATDNCPSWIRGR